MNKEGGSGHSKEVLSVRNALIHGQEQERLRISLELHDKVAQDLFACKMIVNDLALTAGDEDEDLKKSFKKALFLVDDDKELFILSTTIILTCLRLVFLILNF